MEAVSAGYNEFGASTAMKNGLHLAGGGRITWAGGERLQWVRNQHGVCKRLYREGLAITGSVINKRESRSEDQSCSNLRREERMQLFSLRHAGGSGCFPNASDVKW